MKYVSIDVETTGIDPEKHQVLEIGAIIEDTNNQLSFEEIPKFKCIIQHDTFKGSAYAINLNQRIFKILAEIPKFKNEAESYKRKHNILSTDDACIKFIEFLTTNGLGGRFIAAGKNFAGFDAQFLKHMDSLWPTAYQRVLDPGPMYTNFLVDQFPPDLSECKKRAGIQDTEIAHDALLDAWDVIQVLRAKY